MIGWGVGSCFEWTMVDGWPRYDKVKNRFGKLNLDMVILFYLDGLIYWIRGYG